ncbi:helix-turn-helix domain-containing protein [Haladaptatus sp. DYSN1]|uniref:helix-turn-helix domain-containing protein n=1 Tax=unclassified Haladaptatus TaxID=2622732 RepID=UPI002406CA57|nr:helix-turn-helix domain-containing protein [Haladaptatus sp. DYSN1]
MSVIAEFTIPYSEFNLGTVLHTDSEIHIDLERIVPTSEKVMPFFWASGGNLEAFENEVRESPVVANLSRLDAVSGSALYRVEWTEPIESLVHGIAESEATILKANGNREWLFHLRFGDHAHLSQFHEYCLEHDISIDLSRVYTLADGGQERPHGLTADQRETLLLALEHGYFDVPRAATLSEIANTLGISQQAASERVRRGVKSVLSSVLEERS